MALLFNVPKRRRPALTPLIDVIFLLLLFFMLSSTFAKFSEIELVAGAGQGATAKTSPIFMQLQGEEIRVNGSAVSIADLPGQLTSLADNGASLVLLAMDEVATSQLFVDVYAAVRANDALSLAVLNR
ncbi:MAG: biopolymer transporter ExbD [Pseudomonadota bacterium]